MAVAIKGQVETAATGDVIGIYNTNQKGKWECLNQFNAGTQDLLDLKFDKESRHLIVWDSPLSSKIQVFQINGSPTKIAAIQHLTSLQPLEAHNLGVSNVYLS